ncbi:MAG: tRNA threonylcarbamoyladenosine dehydratase [Bacteroidota bacterium]|nr:MAG: tRNA threonylcarbamoyladenosine dehydratase [Bacteroidota bacterium]
MNENDWQCRTELLLTSSGIEKLKNAKVLVAGLGGVGGAAAEQLCRAGIGHLTLVDSDVVNNSNLNRQIIALNSTLNQPKVEAIKTRMLDINPKANIRCINQFIEEKEALELLKEKYDFVIDAIDTLTPKVELLAACVLSATPVVSSMGSGGRINPSLVKIDDIKNSNHCKFAYIVRKYLHRKGIYEGITVVYSTENVPRHALVETDGSNHKRTVVGTISYMPSIFGAFCASVVIRTLLSKE